MGRHQANSLAMRDLLRFLTHGLVALALLVPLSPWLLYELGLTRFDAMPAKPAQIVTAQQQAWVWTQARGSGEPQSDPMNPYGYALRFLAGDGRAEPAESLAYWVAREHNWRQPSQRSMAWWHLSNAALSIWLTRHWTTEELASAAYLIASKWPPRKPRAITPAPAASPPAR